MFYRRSTSDDGALNLESCKMNTRSEFLDTSEQTLPTAFRKSAELAHHYLRRAGEEQLYPGAEVSQADNLAQQLLFETWLKKDGWRLETELIPLLFGIDPEHWKFIAAQEELQAALAPLQESLRGAFACDHGEPSVTPVEIYRWAAANDLKLPAAFEQLIQFIIASVKPVQTSTPPSLASSAAAGARESVLGAALNVVAKWPERCRDEAGALCASRIVGMLEDHAVMFFDSPHLPIAREDARDLIANCLH